MENFHSCNKFLELEHAFSEYEKMGTKVNYDLKTAVLMRCVHGKLKTWLQLQVTESTTYSKVREMILLYDSSTQNGQILWCWAWTILQVKVTDQCQWR